MFAKYRVEAKTSWRIGFGFGNPFHVIAGAQSKRHSCCPMVNTRQTNRFLPMSKQNAASLFKKTLGAQLTERLESRLPRESLICLD